MKALAAKEFVFLLGGQNSSMLDRPSWLEAATSRFLCTCYRFRNIYVRRHKKLAVFAARMSIEARLDPKKIECDVWITDLWQQGGIRRKWRLVERTMSRPDTTPELPEIIREMQLWR